MSNYYTTTREYINRNGVVKTYKNKFKGTAKKTSKVKDEDISLFKESRQDLEEFCKTQKIALASFKRFLFNKLLTEWLEA
jgi:hypothetical protein